MNVEIRSEEWGSYLQSQSSLHYDIASRSWIGDYLDPTTFLACMTAGEGNNRTGWKDARYDERIGQSRELQRQARESVIAVEDPGAAWPWYLLFATITFCAVAIGVPLYKNYVPGASAPAVSPAQAITLVRK